MTIMKPLSDAFFVAAFIGSSSLPARGASWGSLARGLTKATDFRQYNEVMARRSEETAEPLLIDRAAAAELPSAESIREWAREKRAFISSVMSELAEERRAVATSIREEGLRAVMFEEFGGRDADPQDAHLAEVEGADIFIGILGRSYGNPLKTRFSATHT
jgi:hypothetical protein